jgi:hypothetical protein
VVKVIMQEQSLINMCSTENSFRQAAPMGLIHPARSEVRA